MDQKKPASKGSSPSRFEFRSFGQDLDRAHYLMSKLSVPVPEKYRERESEEIYIISPKNNSTNIKIRDGNIDIKTLIQIVDNLEQWKPMLKEEFPLNSDLLRNTVFPALQTEMPNLERYDFSMDAFLAMVSAHPDLLPVYVKKQRFGYMVNNAISEFGFVWINGARTCTISTESTESENVKQNISAFGLTGVENINYLQAIKRVTGLVDKPLPF